MKFFTTILTGFLFFFVSIKLHAQNVMINVITQNSGIVKIGETIFFEIKISNTSATAQIPPYKIRPQISFPSSLLSIPSIGHVLPKGWSITSNKNGVLVLSNGDDIIKENENRNILIAIQGKAKGGATFIVANLFFSDGNEPGTKVGVCTKGDNGADNLSTSSITVI